jgi:hypothetical protein
MQHPLVVLLLLISGARAGFSLLLVAPAAVYVVLRVLAKLSGGWLVRWIVGPELPPHLGMYLLSPGVIGAAFALNAELVGAGAAGSVLTIVVAASIATDLLSMVVPQQEPAP